MNEILRKFLSHDAGPFAQFVKYAFVGGLSTAIHILTFFLCGRFLFPCLTEGDIVVRLLGRFSLLSLSDDYRRKAAASRARNAAFCNVIAFAVANVFCYVLNRLFVFTPGRHSIAIEFLLFFGVSAISTLLGTVVQTVLIARCRIQTTIAFGANLVFSLAINYAMRRFVVFNG